MDIYSPIHCRTYYSFLNGIYSPKDICVRALSMGSRSVGIADVNNFYGLIEFARTAADMGLKALYGTVLYRKKEYCCTLLCINREGFARANGILSRMYADTAGIYDPVADLVQNGWNGLWVISSLPDVLIKLRIRSHENLYAALFYGRPFASFVSWAHREGIPLMALNDAVYSDSADSFYFKVIRAIDLKVKLENLRPGEELRPYHRFVSGEEMKSYFSAVPQALQNASRYVRQSDGFIFPEKFIFPEFNGMSKRKAAEQLYNLCRRGVLRRYGKPLEPESKLGRRLQYELSIITEKGFTGYFLVVHDVVSRFPRTCGRGSAASSIVSYLLGITHVDPLRYDLFFERFLNRGRKDPPDIDIDFPWDERKKVLVYVFKKYEGFSGMVADHVTFGIRSAIREPARIMGIDSSEIDTFAELWRRGSKDGIPKDVLYLARRLIGKPRHLGTHPGGVVITPKPIITYTPVQISPLGWPVIAWEKDGTEDAGLVKIDLLGNRSLGVLRDSISLINREENGKLEWDRFFPLGDAETEKCIAEGDTLGVFYIESPATRQLLKKMGRGSYEHLVIASSIIRPAANKYIHEYVRRLKGGSYQPFPEPVESILKDNLGIMVYQEDVARVAIAAAGFSAVQADTLRKILARKDREKRLKSFRRMFYDGAEKGGLGKVAIDTLWSGILSFDGYSFSKAHSASYAMVSFKLAWIKRRYPLIFYTSVINNEGGYYDRQVYINAVRRMGFSILMPDINRSMILYTCTGKTLVSGLRQLKGVSEDCIRKIIEEREKRGLFSDIFDFFKRVNPNFASIRILVRSGTLDSISGIYTRPQVIWLFFIRDRERNFFGMPDIPEAIRDYSPAVKLIDEIRTVGLCISRHPLEIFEERIKNVLKPCMRCTFIDSRTIDSHEGEKIVIAGILATLKEVKTKTKKAMSFISFEDRFGIFETVLFPEVYTKERDKLAGGIAFLLYGVVGKDYGVSQIQVQYVLRLNKADSINNNRLSGR